MSRPDFPCPGGCACGAVRYQLLDDPLELHVCHCTDCQRVSGSAFVMSLVTRRAAVELMRGEPVRSEFETPEGIRRVDLRCTGCASRVWSEPQGLADLLTVRPGTLDDHGWLQPIAHIWTKSAQSWVEIPAGVLRYEGNPTDPLELVRAWRGRA